MKTKAAIIALMSITFLLSLSCNKAPDVPSVTQEKTLEEACRVYADDWQGLKYHYPQGRDEFFKICRRNIRGKDLINGLWAIRSLIPDGHADFEVRRDGTSEIYPIVPADFMFNVWHSGSKWSDDSGADYPSSDVAAYADWFKYWAY
jgi:hypothetical protein